MPALKFQDGSTLRDMTALYVQDGGTLRTITEGWLQDGSTLRKVWPPIVYVPMTGSVTGPSGSYTASSGSHNIGTSYLSVSNGDPPYTKSWSASGSGFSASGSGTSAVVYCNKNTPGTYYGTVSCVVTDDTAHNKTFSKTVTAVVNAAYVPMSGSISPSSISGSTTDGFGWYTLGTASISVSNGDSPYTQLWSITGSGLRISGSTTGTSAQVQVSKTSPGTYSGTLKCVVTDNTAHTMTKTISVSGTVVASYTAISVTAQPANRTKTHSPSPRSGSESMIDTTTMTTANGTVGSIVYSIANLSGDTFNMGIGVSGNGTHTATITSSGTRSKFDDTTYSITFRVKATDGTSTVYSNYVTFTDKIL